MQLTYDGEPDPSGRMLGVVVRTGEDAWRVAIGTSQERAHDFTPMLTFHLGSIAVVPEGLHRV